jgi:hypothetical protein
MATLPAAFGYFVRVFALGCLFGLVRVPLLVPRLGTRWAELVELPLLTGCVVWLACGVARRHREGPPRRLLRVGGLALAMLLAAEVALGMLTSGRGPWQVLVDRDPVAGLAYYAALIVFALAPWWWATRDRLASAPRGTPVTPPDAGD